MAEAIKSFTFWDTSDTKNNILLSASKKQIIWMLYSLIQDVFLKGEWKIGNFSNKKME